MSVEFCRHIRTTGQRCGVPALRGKVYCYYHHRSLKRHQGVQPDTSDLVLHPMRPDALGQPEPTLAAPQPKPITLDFPPLEDRESIQVAASMIVAALGRNQLDGKRAATMLYGLQVASAVTRFVVDPTEEYTFEIDTVNTADGNDLSCADDQEADEKADEEAVGCPRPPEATVSSR